MSIMTPVSKDYRKAFVSRNDFKDFYAHQKK